MGESSTAISDRKTIKAGLAIHASLNEKLWSNEKMLLDVRVALLKSAMAFYRFLDVPGLKIQDVIFTGSNASFNYTRFSDLDVHLIVDFAESVCPDLAENFFTTKKALWGKTHDVKVRSYTVELYVEDMTNPVTANGVYSLLKGVWRSKPQPVEPKWNDATVIARVQHYGDVITDLLASQPSKADIEGMLKRLKRMRQSGLEEGGEFSIENLTYKGLRNVGLLDKLFAARTDVEDKSLSLENEEQ